MVGTIVKFGFSAIIGSIAVKESKRVDNIYDRTRQALIDVFEKYRKLYRCPEEGNCESLN